MNEFPTVPTESIHRMPEQQLCVLCGEKAKGYAFHGQGGRLCHDDFQEEDTSCYIRWTVYGERPVDPAVFRTAVTLLQRIILRHFVDNQSRTGREIRQFLKDHAATIK